MIVRNGREPQGLDMGPAPAFSARGPVGSFVIASSKPEKIDDRPRENGRFTFETTDDPAIEHRRNQWRQAQIRRREKLASQKGMMNGS